MKELLKYLRKVNGKIRFYCFGFCPKCNCDAPELYDCEVCDWGKVPKNQWMENFYQWLIKTKKS